MPEGLNRREFLRALGLTTAGLGVAGSIGGLSAAAEGANAVSVPRKFWWVKEVDKPTIGVDWKNYKRAYNWRNVFGSLEDYLGGGEIGARRRQELADIGSEYKKKTELEGKPGYTTKDYALNAASNHGWRNWNQPLEGYRNAATPERRGVPKHEGSLEENARIVRAAMRYFGAGTVGFLEMNDNVKKLFWQETGNRRPILFEDVEDGFQDDTKVVYPTSAKWGIVFTLQMSHETFMRSPSQLGTAGSAGSNYLRGNLVIAQTSEFLWGLGYKSYCQGNSSGADAVMPAAGVLAGLGEMSRLNRMISPEYGSMNRVFGIIVTDLPLPPSKPIDFGVMRFCRTCKLCAELCPSRSLSFDTNPTWEGRGGWNNGGSHEAYYEDASSCQSYRQKIGNSCSICFGVCPFALSDEASIQSLWKAISAKTPAFNSTVVQAQRLALGPVILGKPAKDPEKWWHEDLPEYGVNTMRGKRRM